MSWLGKTVGTGLGVVFLGPLGAGIGYAVGNIVDSMLENSDDDSLELQIFLYFFACLGKIAKADGRVSREEIKVIEEIMDERLELDQENRELAIKIFKEAKDSEETFENIVDHFSELNEYDQEVGVTFLSILYEVAIADGVIGSSEKQMLSYAERSLRLLPGTLEDLMNSDSASDLEDAYKILECNPTMTDAQIKSSYRKKCTQFHPDKLHGTSLPPEFTKFANDQLVQINQAYEQICVARSSTAVS